MSKKQSGAAFGDDSVSAEGRGWFARLRAQPGFRTAAVAFVLTVVLGIGGSAAYAYWSLKTDANLVVATARPDLPVVTGKTRCEQFGFGVATIKFTPVAAAQLPADARILVAVSIPDKKLEKLYLVPNSGTFTLRELPGLSEAIGNSLGRWISVSATTAYVSDPAVPLPAAVGEANILDRAKPPAQGAEALFIASYLC